MAHVLVMPRQGNTVESCVIIKWSKKEGDPVSAAETICEVETDKAAFEIPAGADGVVLAILKEAGDDVPVMEPIAVIGAPGEKADLPGAGSVSVGPAEPASGASPRARKTARDKGIDPSSVTGTGPGGRIIERDVLQAAAERPSLTAGAKDALISGTFAVPPSGTGIGGRVRTGDLVPGNSSDGSAQGKPGSAAGSGTAGPFPGPFTDLPMKGIRKITADRMTESLSTTAQFTLSMSAEADRLVSLRERFKKLPGNDPLRSVTINDLVLYAAVVTLKEFPFMNAHRLMDSIRTFERIHLGVAVDTPRGLMVPVIRNADLAGLGNLSCEAARLVEACRLNRILPEELSGSTFTVTNLGGTGVENFTPVLNAPEAAILGVCAIEDRAVPDEKNGFRFQKRIGLSLTINHQAVDGAPAARFLKALCATIADIDIALVRQEITDV